jgi:uncharacterized membrane protein YgcG
MNNPEKFMNTYAREHAAGLTTSRWSKKLLISALTLGLTFAACAQSVSAFQDAQDSQQPAQSGAPQAPQYTPQSPDQLQQLVAPIALYPDSLVAQVLAASTFPAQVVEADRWVQDHPGLKGDALAQAVDQQNWDPSVKALTAFPSVLANMDKNLSWTSSLGDAYYNQQQDVMDAVQVMRQKAQDAGNLKSTEQQTVQDQGSTIVIQPADPEVVYVPAYNPWLVYGYPVAPWPYWYPTPGIWFGGPYLSFGVGFGVGFYGGYGWGWNNWGTNWHNHVVVYNHNTYYSRSNTFYNRNNYYHNGGYRGAESSVNRNLAQEHGQGYNNHNELGATHGGGNDNRGGEHGQTNANAERDRAFGAHGAGVYNQPGASPKPFNGDDHAARGFGYSQPQQSPPRTESGTSSSAFSGYNHGGEARSYSSRGSQSFGGGGGGGGGGGSHGGGGGGGGGGHHK